MVLKHLQFYNGPETLVYSLKPEIVFHFWGTERSSRQPNPVSKWLEQQLCCCRWENTMVLSVSGHRVILQSIFAWVRNSVNIKENLLHWLWLHSWPDMPSTLFHCKDCCLASGSWPKRNCHHPGNLDVCLFHITAQCSIRVQPAQQSQKFFDRTSHTRQITDWSKISRRSKINILQPILIYFKLLVSYTLPYYSSSSLSRQWQHFIWWLMTL